MEENANITDNQFHIKEFYILTGEVKAIKELFTFQLGSLRELIEANFKAIEVATNKALNANDKRLDVMNEFRQALKDQTGTFITRKDFDTQHERVREDIQRLEISRAEMDAKADQSKVDTRFQGNQKTMNRLMLFNIISIGIALLAIAVSFYRH